MIRPRFLLVVLALVLPLVAGGYWLWDWVLGDTVEASGPIQAVPVQLEATYTAPVGEATQTDPLAEEPLAVTASDYTIFNISQADSQVRFTISEELRGQPKEVIGATNQISGEIAVDFNDLSSAQVGDILVNARTLVTDSSQRNQTIRNRILNTDNYEFIHFKPVEIIGLEGSAAPGESFFFQIVGELTIRDVTKEVIFDVAVEVTSDSKIMGSARTTIQRGDYNLVIPSVPFVANVGEDVTLEIAFVAVASSSADG